MYMYVMWTYVYHVCVGVLIGQTASNVQEVKFYAGGCLWATWCGHWEPDLSLKQKQCLFFYKF